jgi:hypothetical protein
MNIEVFHDVFFSHCIKVLFLPSYSFRWLRCDGLAKKETTRLLRCHLEPDHIMPSRTLGLCHFLQVLLANAISPVAEIPAALKSLALCAAWPLECFHRTSKEKDGKRHSFI